MSLKKLFPFLALVIILFVGFGYIKPSVDSVLAKVEEKDRKVEELQAVERTRYNFDVLVSERERLLSQSDGKMVAGYLPTEDEQERLADIINQLSLRSGVIVDLVEIEEAKGMRTTRSGALSLDTSSEEIVPPSAPDLHALSLEVVFRGTYESVKGFLSELSSVARLHEVTDFSVEQQESVLNEAGEEIPSDMLSGSVTARFFSMPEQMYPNAHLLPIFESGTFDLAPVERLRASSDQISTLPGKNGAGRPNPFSL